MKTSTFASLCVTLSALTMAAPGLAQQAARPAQAPATTGDVRSPTPTPTLQPAEAPPHAVSVTRRLDRSALPQGFSVVLVLGDIQGAAAADDVPLAARKALTDMRDFLPFKSYKLLDAAWVMCCGQLPETPHSSTARTRGPGVRAEAVDIAQRGRPGLCPVRVVQPAATREAGAESQSASSRTTARRIADLTDRRGLLEKQISGGTEKSGHRHRSWRRHREAGSGAPASQPRDRGSDCATRRGGHGQQRAAHPSARMARGAIIDTSFAMDVGETVVVGTSRLKGGSQALIALLTAVPPRATERRE